MVMLFRNSLKMQMKSSKFPEISHREIFFLIELNFKQKYSYIKFFLVINFQKYGSNSYLFYISGVSTNPYLSFQILSFNMHVQCKNDREIVTRHFSISFSKQYRENLKTFGEFSFTMVHSENVFHNRTILE